MTLTAPTAAQLKARYPEFDPVADERVGVFISEAMRHVDEGWEDGDQQPGILALAAHKLALEGEPRRSQNPQAPVDVVNGGRSVVRRKVGDVETQFSENSATASSGGGLNLDVTNYGRSFKQLMKLNAPAIGVV